MTRGLRVLVAFSALGNVVANTYTAARVKREIAKRRILPFSKFWEKEHPYYGTPVGALILHWIFSVLTIVVSRFLVSRPCWSHIFVEANRTSKAPNYSNNDEAYNLISVLWTYGHTWIAVFVSIGLAILAVGQLEWSLIVVGWKTLYSLISFYVLLNLFVIILIWWPSPERVGIPSTTAPAVGTGVLAFGVLYWLVTSKVMPTIGLVRQEIPVDEGAVYSSGSSVVGYKV